ncbi:Phosphoribosylformylglycinamidine (FGAM) synthase, PurS component [Lactobacillus equicursoris DSM 19284 = JCM 14600 = CIP 110162]|uniref:Phosphoribosylformylglycinamidine synthase subunit PurS n=3 Tax=Lactobacillus equicursoris TaxID=420645 RepID=K0NRU2_9LACO|nr:phosphoribosylformylglycinamidine synthase subunit PurS [Lactobacillus equicursoris]KRL01917.1 phosphoribosylformylglycinamidine synthase [Lactobacillus equicursoris DSM 19284 = JCM 14600 = CIP 110162]MDD6386478.1 phosphoribosylformylglycinamidine synthase subunit PurS [Lactobacillus equicursoris]MDD6407471.1 phosphoribosylformylglycinamidine synthase subunit PurS [Lactobacillus equicursoris]MST80242.1 phosphoribosylformylglycinamidine synthase subunit PurS [Lactobacillus equicursoris]CCK84
MTTVRIYVTYKQSVFDPQGEAITNSIHSLGHSEVKGVKVGKFFDVTIEEGTKPVEETVKEISEELLVNFNMETYSYKVLEEK